MGLIALDVSELGWELGHVVKLGTSEGVHGLVRIGRHGQVSVTGCDARQHLGLSCGGVLEFIDDDVAEMFRHGFEYHVVVEKIYCVRLKRAVIEATAPG